MRTRERSYVLLEIMLSLLIFALAAWICLELFASGAEAANRAEELNSAPTIAASALERLRAGGSGEELCYDEDFNPCGRDDACYRLYSVAAYEGGDLVRAYARIFDADGELVYELTDAWLEPSLIEGGGVR